MKNELRNVISGTQQVRFGAIIQAIANYLRRCSQASEEVKDAKYFRKQEEAQLEQYINRNKLWVNDIDFSQYVSEGAEQKVYLANGQFVLKLNDAIYTNFGLIIYITY